MFSLNKVNCEYIKLYNEKYSYTDFVFYLFMRIFYNFFGERGFRCFYFFGWFKIEMTESMYLTMI